MLFSFAILCIAPVVVSAIYEDQLGEADWKIENIGAIEHVLFQDKKIVVSSEQGVLALLRQHSGHILWRDVLPRGDRVDNIVLTETRIIGLCNGGSLLRSWSFDSGELQWEAPLLKLPDTAHTLRHQATDLAVDTDINVAIVLQDNCVNYVSLRTGELDWFWCPAEDEVVIAHLVAPVGTRAPGGYRRAAVACRVEVPTQFNSDAATLPCLEISLLVAYVPSKQESGEHSMDLTPLLGRSFEGAVSVTALRSAFSRVSFHKKSDAAVFSRGDIVFAGISDGSVNKIFSISLFNESSAVAEFSHGSQSAGHAASGVFVSSWTLRGQAGVAPAAVVSFCQHSLSLALADNTNRCDVYTVDAMSAAVTEVVSCSAESLESGYFLSSVVAAVERESSHLWSSVRSVGCSQISLSKRHGDSAIVRTKAVHEVGVGALTVSVEVPALSFGEPLISSLRSSNIQMFTKNSVDNKMSLRSLYVGAGVGSVFLAQGNRVAWTREEALAQIKQVLMIPRPQRGIEMNSESNVPTKASLTLSSRLRMQYSDLLHMWTHFSRWLSLEGHLLVLRMLDASARREALYNLARSAGITISYLKPASTTPDRRGNSALRYLENSASRESRDSVGSQFGFDKYAVVLSYPDMPGVKNGDVYVASASEFLDSAVHHRLGAKVLALDLIHGETVWSVEPNIELFADHVSRRRKLWALGNRSSDRVQLYLKLLPGATHRDENYGADLGVDLLAEGVGVSILVASSRYIPPDDSPTSHSDVLTCVWHMDVHSGRIHGANIAKNGPTMCLPTGPGAVIGATFVDRGASAQVLHTCEAGESIIGGTYTHLLLRHDDLSVSAYPPEKVTFDMTSELSVRGIPQYVHTLSSPEGMMLTYMIQRKQRHINVKGCEPAIVSGVVCPDYVTYALSAVGSAITQASPGDRVVAVAHPAPHDKVTSRAYVLGDKSLLLKYLNPNLVVVVSECFGEIIGKTVNSTSAEEGESHLVVSVLDTVSGRVVYRYEIVHGGPAPVGVDGSVYTVSAEIIEHAIVVTYWNFKAQRMELSSLMLYEGMIPKSGLGPITSYQAPSFIDVSSFTAPQPIGLQKTFVLPKAVVSLQHTLTLKGLTNKHLLLGLRNGQVFRLDMRLVDPRRPLTAPTQAEKEEGLVQYNPFVPFAPQSAVTNNDTVAGLRGLASSPSMALESVSLVLVYGIDVFFTRVSPSKGFDMLSSEFNRPLLSLILSVMCVLVLFLRKMHKDKVIKSAWK